MSSILGQLAVAIGGLVFILSLIFSWINGVPLIAAILRAMVAMCVASMIMAFFFRFFTAILYRFVAERIQEQNAVKEKEPKGKEKTTPNSTPV
jgi:DNA integrity scanning protein DisA with diadenylate cyclase activity